MHNLIVGLDTGDILRLNMNSCVERRLQVDMPQAADIVKYPNVSHQSGSGGREKLKGFETSKCILAYIILVGRASDK